MGNWGWFEAIVRVVTRPEGRRLLLPFGLMRGAEVQGHVLKGIRASPGTSFLPQLLPAWV